MYNRSRRIEYQLTKPLIVLVVSGTRLGLYVGDRRLDTNMADAWTHAKKIDLKRDPCRTYCRHGDSRLRDERDTITTNTIRLSLSTFPCSPNVP